MPGKLIIPKDPGDIRSVSLNEPMRMTLNGAPATAIRVGPDNGTSVFLVITKDGEVISGSVDHFLRSLRFIDYLTEDESFTVFGSALERTEDDINPMIGKGLPSLEIGCDAWLVPDFAPFIQQTAGHTLHSIFMPGKGDINRLSLSFQVGAYWMPYGNVKNNGSRVFMGFLEDQSIERWRTHPQRHLSRGVETWPSA